jgi:hypothetical protein
MRILDHRYSRDLRRHDLALRLIRHELRTATIVVWTGLSRTRIRKLYHSYIPEGVLAGLRHRGPPPTSVQVLLRSQSLNAEAAGLAGLCFAIGVLPAKPLEDAARELPSLTTGERLCYAFELYQQLVPKPQITLEQLVLLVTALARGQQAALVHCTSCDGLMLVTLLHRHRRVCSHCLLLSQGAARVARDARGTFRKVDENEAEPDNAADPPKGLQRTLF